MKKIIAASILSLMLLGFGGANSDGMLIGVGTAYADGDAHTWYFDRNFRRNVTPMEDCIEAARDGLLIFSTATAVIEGAPDFPSHECIQAFFMTIDGDWNSSKFSS